MPPAHHLILGPGPFLPNSTLTSPFFKHVISKPITPPWANPHFKPRNFEKFDPPYMNQIIQQLNSNKNLEAQLFITIQELNSIPIWAFSSQLDLVYCCLCKIYQPPSKNPPYQSQSMVTCFKRSDQVSCLHTRISSFFTNTLMFDIIYYPTNPTTTVTSTYANRGTTTMFLAN